MWPLSLKFNNQNKIIMGHAYNYAQVEHEHV